MSVYQLIYRSDAARPWGDAELERLAAQARIHNYSLAITSVLFFDGQQFLQVLEGGQEAVEALYAHISHDPRHTNLAVMLGGAVPQRLFPKWSLGLSQVAAADLSRLSGYLDPRHRNALLPERYNAHEVISDLLSEFVAEQVVRTSSGTGPRQRG